MLEFQHWSFTTGSFPRPRPLGATAHRVVSRLQRSACGCVMHQIPHILRRPTGSNPAFAPDGLSLSPFREVSAPVEFGYEYRGIPVDRSYAVVKVHVPCGCDPHSLALTLICVRTVLYLITTIQQSILFFKYISVFVFVFITYIL